MIRKRNIEAIFVILIITSSIILAATPTTVSTFNSISLYWSPDGGLSSRLVTVKFRESGETTWRTGLPMKYNPIADTDKELTDYRGSIVMLTSGTTYEIQLSLEGTTLTETITASTWNESFSIAETITVGNSSSEYSITSKNGSASGYILYDGTGSTIDVNNNYDYCIDIDNSSYIIIRGFNLTDAKRSGIRLASGCSNIIIENCDISGWGRKETVNDFGVNQDAGIYSDRSDLTRVIIQRNKIHDPRYDSNNLSEDNDGSVHPSGPQGIVFYNNEGNHVIRYNEIWSDYEHMYNDIIGGATNASFEGFPGTDSDINNNYFSHCWDDGIEAEGGNRNVRIWSNFIDSTFIAIGNAATSIGPLYVWKNTAGRSYTPLPNWLSIDHAAFMKMGYSTSVTWMTGHMYIFNNTVLQTNNDGYSGLGVSVTDNRYIKHCESRNNIFQTRGTENSISTRTENEDNDYDYDLHNNGVPSGSESNGISGTPTYESGSGFNNSTMTAQFNLQSGTSGYNAGIIIPNFADNYEGTAPDIGAFEAGRDAIEYGVNATTVTYSSATYSGGTTTQTLPNGAGTSSNPYQIGTLGELSWVLQNSSSWDKYFEQTTDIDASQTANWDDADDDSDGDKYNDTNDGTSSGNNEGWAGIGVYGSADFTGTYDGKGYIINGLTMNRPNEDFLGFFNGVSTGTIKNLGLTNIDFSIEDFAGGLVGANEGATFLVDNCYTTGNITGNTGYVIGGLVGYLGRSGHGGTVQNSYSEVAVIAASVTYAGSFIGLSKAGTVSKCYATGNVSSSKQYAGAFIGELQSATSVTECYSTGNVNSSEQYCGGFIASIRSNSVVRNCYSTGDVAATASAPTGGFIGQNQSGTIEYCYSVGTNNQDDTDGFLGNIDGTGHIHTANFLDTDASGCTASTGAATVKTTTQMKIESTFSDAGWDFATIWEIVDGDGANYPRLINQPDPALPVELTSLTAELADGSVLLKWETATEINNYGFNVEASNDGVKFIKIGFVDGHGNSNLLQSYSFVASVYSSYRLKQIDVDGGFEYSAIVTVNENELAKVELFQNNPNPFNPSTVISFNIPSNGLTKLSVYNLLGQRVATLVNEKLSAGLHKYHFDASGLTSGVYFYRLQIEDFSKVRKMLLIK